MKNEELHQKLNELWESKITEIKIDILRNKIGFTLEWFDGFIKKAHIIEFRNVSAYFFVNNVEEQRKKFITYEKEDYLELSSINLINGDTEIRTKSEEKWIEQFNAKANIAIEMWDKFLFLETEIIEIDSKVYEITT